MKDILTGSLLVFLCSSAFAGETSPYEDRYSLSSLNLKLIDNNGEGFEPLYGLRNVRAVLNEVIYRGGGNNKYNRYGSRDNRNPLPKIGLQNLCEEGFDTAVYLYSENFDTAPKRVNCVNRITGKPNTLDYLQFGPYNEPAIRKAMALAHEKIKSPNGAPAYLHCWNGWHASGLISAYLLRQFCGFSGNAAVAYWDLNTDGNDKDPNFVKIRKNIQDYVPYTDLPITPGERKRICLPAEAPKL